MAWVLVRLGRLSILRRQKLNAALLHRFRKISWGICLEPTAALTNLMLWISIKLSRKIHLSLWLVHYDWPIRFLVSNKLLRILELSLCHQDRRISLSIRRWGLENELLDLENILLVFLFVIRMYWRHSWIYYRIKILLRRSRTHAFCYQWKILLPW